MRKTSKINGFTLIELMIVVGIIGVLASVALPVYSQYIIRGNRTDAMETLTEVMAQQQRFILRQRTFTINLNNLNYPNPLITVRGLYSVTAAACPGSVIARCVRLTAAPRPGPQTGDGNLTLDSRGQKTFNGAPGWDQR